MFIVGGAHHGPPALNDSPAAVKTGMTNVASHFCYRIEKNRIETLLKCQKPSSQGTNPLPIWGHQLEGEYTN